LAFEDLFILERKKLMDTEDKYKVQILPSKNIIQVEKGILLKKVLTDAGIDLEYPCGGGGKCGKCLVEVAHTDHSEGEKKLACTTTVNSDLYIKIDSIDFKSERKNNLQIKEDFTNVNTKIKKIFLDLSKRERNFLSDQELLQSELTAVKIQEKANLDMLRLLPNLMRQGDYKLTVVTYLDALINLEAGDTRQELYGFAFDIGTTTVVGSLLNLNTGKILGIESADNPQKTYGADVISRITFTINEKNGLKILQERIINTINELIYSIAAKNKISPEQIYEATFVGNTTMMHLLLGINPANLAAAPYVPAFKYPPELTAKELLVAINPLGRCTLIPNIEGYVGTDTVAAILSSKLYQSETIKLLIDIGTNGEMVLGSTKKGFVSCSTAAGPAFEGAHIQFGMRAALGAIEKVVINEDVTIKTINNEPALGICGSGLIDAIAEMLKAGVINYKGNIIKREDAEALPIKLQKRIVCLDRGNGFILSHAKDNQIKEDILIMQKDIRELQLAKGAILAGIQLLQEKLGIKEQEIEEIILAGAFGSYIDKLSALRIGLFPQIAVEKIQSVGNAAGVGAQEILFKEGYQKAGEIAEKVNYLELSLIKEFQDKFLKALNFPLAIN
jgi:uncharacterized 2Fe-2S/4Fe-4S cluster protein (DUF4445 family)